MKIKDRHIVFGIYLFFALIGIAGAWLAISVRQRPLIEFEQQRLGNHLRFAYQKYHNARGMWPERPEEAIRGYTQEAPQLPDFYEKAKKEWDVSVQVTEGTPTLMLLRFRLPAERDIELALSKPN